MMNKVFLFLKGVAIGMTDIIPGVSGATTAMLLGIYDTIIAKASATAMAIKSRSWGEAMANLLFLLPLFVGVATGLALFARVIHILLDRWPVAVQIVFAGLILGSLPAFLHNGGVLPVRKNKVIAFLIGATLMLLILFWDHQVQANSLAQSSMPTIDIAYIGKIFIMGLAVSIATALPGISGSLILLLLGEYMHVLAILNDWVSHVVRGNMQWLSFFTLAAFGIGLLIGLVSYALIVEGIMKRHKEELFSFSFGLILFSVIKVWPRAPFGVMECVLLIAAMMLPILLDAKGKKP
jgi:putative membrane protein